MYYWKGYSWNWMQNKQNWELHYFVIERGRCLMVFFKVYWFWRLIILVSQLLCWKIFITEKVTIKSSCFMWLKVSSFLGLVLFCSMTTSTYTTEVKKSNIHWSGYFSGIRFHLLTRNTPRRYYRFIFTKNWLRLRKINWRRNWQLSPLYLPGESYGQRSLAG